MAGQREANALSVGGRPLKTGSELDPVFKPTLSEHGIDKQFESILTAGLSPPSAFRRGLHLLEEAGEVAELRRDAPLAFGVTPGTSALAKNRAHAATFIGSASPCSRSAPTIAVAMNMADAVAAKSVLPLSST
jgi:hypothetical protein